MAERLKYPALYVNAGNDRNGNPRRGWLVIDTLVGVVAFVDEGYGGKRALTHAYPQATEMLGQAIPVTPGWYREMMRGERGNPRPRRTARRTRLLKTMGFFKSHAGGVVGQAAKGALSLARAEKYARDHGWDIDLAPEQERYEDVYGEPDPGGEWVTVILRDRHSKVLGSLGFVDASDKNYLRVVAAELAAEAMP